MNKDKRILLELYEVGRRILPMITGSHGASIPTQRRFERALDTAQDILFPNSKHKTLVYSSRGAFFLMGERLVEFAGNIIWRWVMRQDLAGLQSGQTKHIALFEGIHSSYPVTVFRPTSFEGLQIGCIEFDEKATKQILEWANKKPKKSKSA